MGLSRVSSLTFSASSFTFFSSSFFSFVFLFGFGLLGLLFFFFTFFFKDLPELLPPRLADQLGWFMIFGGGLELQSKRGPSLSSFFENLPPKFFLGLGGAGPP